MKASRSVLPALAVLGGLLLTSPAQAVVSYPNFMTQDLSFTAVTEETTTAGDPEPLFGAPTYISGNSLIWVPTGFISTAAGGSTDQTASTYKATVDAKNKQLNVMTGVTLVEVGDFSLTGGGTASTSASVLAGLFITVLEINLNGILIPTAILASDSFFISYDTPPQGGNWNGSVTIDIQSAVQAYFPGAFATKVAAIFNNDLATTSEESSTALIQKKTAVQSVTLTIVPEPSTGALLLLGLVALAAARRRA